MEPIEKLHQLRIESWQIKGMLWEQSFFTFPWLLIAVVIATSYFIWWKLADKRRIVELLLYGSFIAVCRVIFDNWGISSGRWTYTTDLFPMGYSLFLNDLTVIPLSLMLVYQYAFNWRSFFLMLIVVQGLTSFLLWPLLSSFDVLKVHDWKLYYSYLFMIFIASIMRLIMIAGLKLQRESRLNDSQYGEKLFIPEPAMKRLDDEE